jgi:hypothetical protein
MSMTRSMFRDKTRCCSLKVNWRFGKKHITFIFRCWRLNQARNLYEAGIKHSFLGLFFSPERWRRYVLPKRRLTFNGQQGTIFEKTEFSIKIWVPNNFNIEFSLNLLHTAVISTENSRESTFTYCIVLSSSLVSPVFLSHCTVCLCYRMKEAEKFPQSVRYCWNQYSEVQSIASGG